MFAAQERPNPRRMPPPRGYVRKILTVPPALAAAVKEFRFERRLESDVEAYRLLIQEGLESLARKEKRGREPKPGKKS